MIKFKGEYTANLTYKAPVSIAIVLTCHTPYLEVLPNQIRAVDNQTRKASEKFLALDGCDYTPPEGWQVIKGDWKEPNPGRNIATLKAQSDWIIYVDADDEMNLKFIEAMANKVETVDLKTGIIYADIKRGNNLDKIKDNLKYKDQLIKNHISASCCWRRHAVIESGLFPENNDHYDDWTLANKLMFRAWKAEYQSQIPIECYPEINKNLPHRSNLNGTINKWNSRSYTIISLLAGRINCYHQWLDWLRQEEKPTNTKLLVIDNSHSEKFHRMIRESVISIEGLQSIEIRKCNLKIDEVDLVNKWHEWGKRHLHVSRIYTEILPLINTDMILFLEDDTIPKKGAFKQLVDSLLLKRNMAGVSAVYPSRNGLKSQNKIVGAPEGEFWQNCYSESDLPKDGSLMKVGFIAGGFSLWRTGVVLQALPLCWDAIGTILRGWDTRLCLQARQMGWQLYIDPKVVCKHLINEDKNILKPD